VVEVVGRGLLLGLARRTAALLDDEDDVFADDGVFVPDLLPEIYEASGLRGTKLDLGGVVRIGGGGLSLSLVPLSLSLLLLLLLLLVL
jgi:hypothetical protein